MWRFALPPWLQNNKDNSACVLEMGGSSLQLSFAADAKEAAQSEVAPFLFRKHGWQAWSLEAPEGHMPLVNQLRGVRLMDALLNHPALQQRR